MNYDKKKLYIFQSAICCLFLLVCFIPSLAARNFTAAALTAGVTALAYLLIKKRGISSLENRQAAIIVALSCVLAIALLYMSGMKFGFKKDPFYSAYLVRSFIPLVIALPFCELLRKRLLDQKNKLVNVLSFFAFVFIDCAMQRSSKDLGSFNGFTEFLGFVVFPALAVNLMLHIFSAKFGIIPNLTYRAVMYFYYYVLPIKPELPESLTAFLKLLFPLILLGLIRSLYERKKRSVSKNKFSVSTAISSFVVLILMLVIMLISCRFKYGMLVIATGSMTGTIDIGDAVIYESYDGEENLEEQTIAIFQKNGITYIHRIVKTEYVDGEMRYYTKGDNNPERDTGYITNANIVGTTDFTIKYIGLPTLWMRGLFG